MAAKLVSVNVDQPVGPNGTNQPDDVLLVRFLLRRVSQLPILSGPYNQLPLVPNYDAQLGAAISWFQKTAKQKGLPIATDGHVSHAPKFRGPYTINHLYGTYHRHYPQYAKQLESDPEYPKALAMRQIASCE